MLVLKRKAGEKIIIGDDEIIITILSTKGKEIKIGIEADPKWRIMRDELLTEENKHEN